MHIKFLINFLLIKLFLSIDLYANQSEEYNLIDKSYKNFLKNAPIEKNQEWYNKPCEYIDYLQKQFLKSENEEEGKEYAKLLKLALQDGLYFKYQKQNVPKNQINQLSGLFQRAKVISNIGEIDFKIEPNFENANVYQKTFYSHFKKISLNNFKAFSWKDTPDPNYVIDNFWIMLQENLQNQDEKKAINIIKTLPLHQRDILPQYFLNKIMGFGKNQNYRILELFKKPLNAEYIEEMQENLIEINITAPYFFYNPNEKNPLSIKAQNQHSKQIDDNALKVYIINQKHVRIDCLDDLKYLNSEDSRNSSSLDLYLPEKLSIDNLKVIFDKLKNYNFYEIKLFITFYHHELAHLLIEFLDNFKNLYDLRLDINNSLEESIKINPLKNLKKLNDLHISYNGSFDFSDTFEYISTEALNTLLLFNKITHTNKVENPTSLQKFCNDISKAKSLKSLLIYDQNLINNEKDTQHFSFLLNSLKNLEELYLPLKIANIAPKTYKDIFEIIQQNKNISDLELQLDFFEKQTNIQFNPQPIKEEMIRVYTGFLEVFDKIKKLNIGLSFEKKNQNIQSLTNILKKLSNLNRLSLNFAYTIENEKIDPEIFTEMISTISKFQNLQNFSLFTNNTTEHENQAIIRVINNLQHLKHISLHTHTHNNNDCEDLLKAIGRKKELKYLHLSFSQNDLYDGFYYLLSQELQKLKNLEYLNFNIPMIRDESQQIITDTKKLSKNPKYQSLILLTTKLNNLQKIQVNFVSQGTNMEEHKKHDEIVNFANERLTSILLTKKKTIHQTILIKNMLQKFKLRNEIGFEILSFLLL